MSLDLNKSCGNEQVVETCSGNVSISGGETDESCFRNATVDSNPEEDEGDGNADVEMHSNSSENCGTEMAEGLNSVEALKKKIEKSLEVGSILDSLDDVHKLYSDYAHLMGFSVRKRTQGYFQPTLDVRMKMYHCSCEGPPDNKRSLGRLPVCKKQSYRTNCKARLHVSREDIECPWKVTVFVKEHNHELVHPSESYLLRSARNLSRSKKNLLISMCASGIGVSRAYRFVENEAGSRENMRFIRKDVYNELHRENRNVWKINNGDANSLLQYFTKRGMSDHSFYWKVKLSDDGRLQHLFFRDTRCLIDYQHFGDVVSVDVTYKTNKYDLICVPLKEPSVIFSDQDMALMNALDYTFRHASHRLCQWHINKNVVKHVGKLNHDKDFKNQWCRCMNGCESEEQFERSWRRMIKQHNLVENKWLGSIYTLRKRWSVAFARDKFSRGLHATSRSEVTNKVLKELCSSTSTLHEFVVGFERMQKSWHTREFEEDALCRGRPGMFVQHTSILVQVGELCTRNVFKSFEYEALHSISVNLTQEPLDINDEVLKFKVSSRSSVTGERIVKFNQTTKFAICSCHLRETEGIFYRHLFRVYFHLNQHSVPDEMILNRWRKDAKQRICLSQSSSDSRGPNKFSNMVFVNHNTKLVYDMLTECKEDSICRDAINEYISKMINAVKTLRLESTGNPNGTFSQKGFKEPLLCPIKNPISMRKRPYRRMRFSKNSECRGYDGQKTSNRSQEVEESEERLTQTQLDCDEVHFRRYDDPRERFSIE